MQLNISNVGKIEEATINIDGITVIAGENNSGKSTIGKVLFSIFNSMNNINEKVVQERRNKIYNIINMLFQGKYYNRTNDYLGHMKNIVFFTTKLTDAIMECSIESEISDLIKTFIEEFSILDNISDIEEATEECEYAVKSVLRVSDEKLMTEVITRLFLKVFENQLSPLIENDLKTKVELVIKNKRISCDFENNICINCNSEINVLHGAFYVDDPFVLDKMSRYTNVKKLKITEEYLLKHLMEDSIDIFDAIMIKDKLSEINNLLGEVLVGDIIETLEGEFCFKNNNFVEPLSVKNLSTGLKSFALIKELLENGSIKQKDVLILDEPEIHLHPEWQLVYAELIVLLQREFDLSVVITTHSPYFLDAIDVFTSKYGTASRTHYYLSENKGDIATIQDVTNNIDDIYKKLSDPMQKLENLRYSID